MLVLAHELKNSVLLLAQGLKTQVYSIFMCHADIGISKHHDNIKISRHHHGDIRI